MSSAYDYEMDNFNRKLGQFLSSIINVSPSDPAQINQTYYLKIKADEVNISDEEITKLMGHMREDGIFYWDVSSCDNSNQSLPAMCRYIGMEVLCTIVIVFLLTLLPAFLRLARQNRPAFYILFNQAICSIVKVCHYPILYFEAIFNYRIPDQYNMSYVISVPLRAESVFYFLFSLNRCFCILMPMRYPSIFKKRKIICYISIIWAYSVLHYMESLIANKGSNRLHCLDFYNLDDMAYYGVIMTPFWQWVDDQFKDRYLYNFVWFGPSIVDIVTLGKLLTERKFDFKRTKPWIALRPALPNNDINEAKKERIRLFLLCLLTTTHHFLFAYVFNFNNASIIVNSLSLYHIALLEDTIILFLLILWFNEDVRNQWLANFKWNIHRPNVQRADVRIRMAWQQRVADVRIRMAWQ